MKGAERKSGDTNTHLRSNDIFHSNKVEILINEQKKEREREKINLVKSFEYAFNAPDKQKKLL